MRVKAVRRVGVAGVLVSVGLVAGVVQRAEARFGPPPDGVVESPENAALLHYQAIMLRDPELSDLMRDWIDRDGPLGPEVVAALEAHQGTIGAYLLPAASLERADFGVRYDLGWEALLPHLGGLRDSARLLVLDARRLAGRDPAGSAARLAAAVRVGEHAADGAVIIGKLVGYSVVSMACKEIERQAQAGVFGEPERGVLLGALGRVDRRNPLGMDQAIRMEGWILSRTVERMIGRAGPGGRVFAGEYGALLEGVEDERALAALRSMDADGARVALGTAEEMFEAVGAMWLAGPERWAFEVLEATAGSGGAGPLALVFSPSVSKVAGTALKLVGEVERAEGALRRGR